MIHKFQTGIVQEIPDRGYNLRVPRVADLLYVREAKAEVTDRLFKKADHHPINRVLAAVLRGPEVVTAEEIKPKLSVSQYTKSLQTQL